MNKIKFWIGCGKAQLIVIINLYKLFHIIDLDNHDYIILVECIGFASEIIPPMLLVFRVTILYKWC